MLKNTRGRCAIVSRSGKFGISHKVKGGKDAGHAVPVIKEPFQNAQDMNGELGTDVTWSVSGNSSALWLKRQAKKER